MKRFIVALVILAFASSVFAATPVAKVAAPAPAPTATVKVTDKAEVKKADGPAKEVQKTMTTAKKIKKSKKDKATAKSSK